MATNDGKVIINHQGLRRPFWGKAANMTPPGTPVLSQSLQLSPGVSSFFGVCFQIAAPCVSRPCSFFLFLSGFQVNRACRVMLFTGLRRV